MTTANRYKARIEAKRRNRARQAWKSARDAAIAFAAFTGMALTVGSSPLHAGPSAGVTTNFSLESIAHKALAEEVPAPVVQIATVSAADEQSAIYRRTSFAAAWTLLGASFALLAALNLAIVRHLGRAYVRRRPVGRGQN